MTKVFGNAKCPEVRLESKWLTGTEVQALVRWRAGLLACCGRGLLLLLACVVVRLWDVAWEVGGLGFLGAAGGLEVREVAGVGCGAGTRGVWPGGLVHKGGGSLGRGKGLSGGRSGAAA